MYFDLTTLLYFLFTRCRLPLGSNTVMRSSALFSTTSYEHVDCWIVFTVGGGRRGLMQTSLLRANISVTVFPVFAVYSRTLRNDCFLFTFDKDVNILTECRLTHCILHHHYLVNKNALLVFRTAI